MNTEFDSIAVRSLIREADETICAHIMDAVNSIEGRSIASVVVALASIIGQVLSNAPEEVQSPLWSAFQHITLAQAKLHALTESADGIPN